jgi:two-component system, sensor histidine kinase RpfC
VGKGSAVAAGLMAYGLLAPLVVAMLAGSWLSPPLLALALVATLLGPALAAALAAARGFGALASDPMLRHGEEPRQAIIRLLLAAALLAYVAAAAIARITDLRLHALELLATAASPAAWLTFVHAIAAPRSRLRRALAPLADAVFLGLFLHWGGRIAAPWAALYLALAFDEGLRFGPAALAYASLVNVVSAAAVAVSTPLWRAMPLADGAFLVALGVLPLYGAAFARRAIETSQTLAQLRDERLRLGAFLRHELGIPVAAIGASAASFAPATAGEREAVSTLQVAARMLGSLLDALLAPAAAAQPEPFELREALSDAVQILRPEARAKGIALALTIDPRLPHRVEGRAVRLGELMMNLLAAALAAASDGSIMVTATLLGRDEASLRMQLKLEHQGMRVEQPPPLPRAVAAALARIMGGALVLDEDGGSASLELTLAAATMIETPDLTGVQVLLATRDSALAERLAELVRSWGGVLGAFREVEPLPGRDCIVMLDARSDALAALALAHRLATAADGPTVVLVAPVEDSTAIARLAASDIAALVEEASDAALADALASARAVAMPAQQGAAGLNLLVAAGDGADIKAALERLGHRVVLAADGGAALAAIDKGGFDGAFLELGLKSMGGEAVAKLSRLRHAGAGLPLVALAPDQSPETEAHCREAGFDAVAAETDGPAMLLAALERAREARRGPSTVLAPDVTHIASHPRYLGEGGEVVREATLDSLRGLGGPEFVADVVESFRNDALRIIARLRQAAARADLRAFAEAAHALHSGAANVGGVRLAETLSALEDLGPAELKQAGAAFVEKIESELARLDQALEPFARKERRG